MTDKFIVYACPTGELNTQLETFFQRSYTVCGKNKAHNYMPHCTLTGFFADNSSSISYYLEALDLAYQNARQNLSLDIQIIQPVFNSDWHGLELQAEGVKQLTRRFAQLETSPTRQENIRLKDWLHLSLAYGFESGTQEQLETLARETIDLTADVVWELRFYQKNDANWNCLQSWTLG
ncbi:MAG: hypothetical protein AAFO95_00795 [Cyanobacteria bacterium J06600_6]